MKTESLFYLIGLICGKGHILKDNSLAINFNHKEKYLQGIAHCPKCGWLATGLKDLLKCKNKDCENSKKNCIDKKIKKTFNQKNEAQNSIKKNIIPFLKKGLNFDYQILSTSSSTILILEEIPQEIFNYIVSIFKNEVSFDKFEINEELSKEKLEYKKEFISGLLDTCGFFNQGNWYPRSGKNGNTRMRVYFQIVRNWKMPIQIDNYLRKNFNIPIQTIRWGHPNIVDPDLKYYYEDNSPNAAFKEHQIKLVPESLQDFEIRLEPKKTLFKELLNHNLKVNFDNVDDWLESKRLINENSIKPCHPMNNDIRISDKVRGKHIDASWQISLHMGCENLSRLRNSAKNKKLFEITGETSTETDDLIKKYEGIALKKLELKQIKSQKKTKHKKHKKNSITEADTYQPLVNWLKEYILKNYKEESEVFDTSAQTLANYFSMNFTKEDGFNKKIRNLEKLNIRPDVIGISKKSKKVFFIESKVVSLGVKELGQIWAYSVIGDPFKSFLISTNEISKSLLNVYAQNKNNKFLNYKDENEIVIGCLDMEKGVKLFNDW